MIRKKIILFDLDGTLIDSTEAILESFEYAFGSFGVTCPSHESIKSQIGHPLDVMFVELGVSEGEVWDFVAKYKENYQKVSKSKTTLLPHAKEAVMEAYTFARLGVVTTKTGKFSIELLEHFGLMEYFDVVIGREDVEHPKPHPEPILRALESFDDITGGCTMIGDTCMDMESAKAAGIDAIGVLCGYGSRAELEGCTQLLVSSVLKAVTYLRIG